METGNKREVTSVQMEILWLVAHSSSGNYYHYWGKHWQPFYHDL